MIAEHNEDETAHLGAGQSLQSHKASEVIDHLIHSIIYDKIANQSIDWYKLAGGKSMMFINFESSDSWEDKYTYGNGTILWRIHNLRIYTGTQETSGGFVGTGFAASSNSPNFDKNPIAQLSMRVTGTGNYMAGFAIGTDYEKCVGFMIIDGVLNAYSFKDSDHSEFIEIPDIDVTVPHVYRIEVNSDEDKALCYVDGILKATLTQQIPTGAGSDFLSMGITQTVAEAGKYIYFGEVIYSQDL